MRSWKSRLRIDQMVVYFLPGLHFGLCIVATFWPRLWSVLLFFDFPVSVVIIFGRPSAVNNFYVLGTLWWYALSWAALAFVDPEHKLGR
jgi:hypothetical protein